MISLTLVKKEMEKKNVNETDGIPVYEMSFNLRMTWHGHSLSNSGSDGSIRLLPRRQMLANGIETDACSGNINKHHHAVLLAEYLDHYGVSLCPACAARDGRRASALTALPEFKNLSMSQVLNQCGLCDAHGFLITGKSKGNDDSGEVRQRLSKHSLIEFSYDLALPETHAETTQLTTRVGTSHGEGQMLMKQAARSGEYARCIRYKSVGIGVDTDRWELHLDDQEKRTLRHRAILSALRDQVLSPLGAKTATMLPHLTGLEGVIVVRPAVGRAMLYSSLEENFVDILLQMVDDSCRCFPFSTVAEFQSVMTALIENSFPALPAHVQIMGQAA